MKDGKFAFITHMTFSTLLILTLSAAAEHVSHMNLVKWPSSRRASL